VKNSRETLPLGARASCSKLLNVCSKKFQGNSVFSGQAQVAQNSECKKYVPYSGKIQGKLCFSRQVLVAQKS